MSDEKQTQPGAVDDDAMKRVKTRKAAQRRALEDAWNTGRNNADPSRKKKAKVDQN
ncbi:MAG: hypothetical protein ACYTE8_00490 [Planctomycetota bacterium]|jgi:hypothetical protein